MCRISLLLLAVLLSMATHAQPTRSEVLGKQMEDAFISGNYTEALELSIAVVQQAEVDYGKNSQDYVSALHNYAFMLEKTGDPLAAEKILLQTIVLAEEQYGKNHEEYVNVLITLGGVYETLARYDASENAYKEGTIILQRQGDTLSEVYSLLMNNLGNLYQKLGKYREAIPLYETSLRITADIHGKEHDEYASNLSNAGLLYSRLAMYSQAEEVLLQSRNITERLHGRQHIRYMNVSKLIAQVYLETGRYEAAVRLLQQVGDFYKGFYGEKSAPFASVLNDLATACQKNGYYRKAEVYYEKCLQTEIVVWGEEHPDYLISYLNLAVLYNEMGCYKKAYDIHIRGLQLQQKALGTEHPDVGISLNNLAEMYAGNGRYDLAEPLYKKALLIMEQAFGKKHPRYALVKNNMAILGTALGRYEEALLETQEVLDIYAVTLGKDHPDYGKALASKGAVLAYLEKNTEAEKCYDEGIAILEKQLGKNNPQLIIPYQNRALNYEIAKNYPAAGQAYLGILTLIEDHLGKENNAYAYTLYRMAMVSLENDHLEKFREQAEAATTIYRNLYGEGHPELLKCYYALGTYHAYTGKGKKSLEYYAQAQQVITNTLNSQFSFISQKEKLKYLEVLHASLQQMQALAFDRKENIPELARLAYENELLLKGLVLRSTENIRHEVAETRDPQVLATYEKWQATQQQLAKEYMKPLEERRKDLMEVQHEANDLEKELTRFVSGINRNTFVPVTFEQVKRSLKPGEAAIEMVAFQRLHSDDIQYLAYVINPGAEFPEMIPLFSEKALIAYLEKSKKAADLETVAALYADTRGVGVENAEMPLEANTGDSLYHYIWKPLEAALEGIHTIYYAPAGALNKVSFAAITLPGEKYLSGKYHLVTLSSTRNTGENVPFPAPKSVVLLGGINYATAPATEKKRPVQQEPLMAFTRNGNDVENTQSWNYLPGTKTETDAIHHLLAEKGINTRVYQETAASEEQFKLLQGRQAPEILHIATHGFFFPVAKENKRNNTWESSEDPLLRSGLVLAGANHVWTGKPAIDGVEDGILTAFEVAAMDLTNTRLVVLSACETGLGELKGSEGVFGLQRAFKQAGAGYIIMSLWQVPDKETVEFMTVFYTHLAAGKEIETAFHLAQKELREKYAPFYWAAFVLVR